MARNQVWDKNGNLIEDIEVPDKVTTQSTIEELEATVTDLVQLLADKGVLY